MYINMIISEWQMSFETRALTEKRLRAISREMFSGHPGRAYWRQARELRLTTYENKRTRRFHQILDEEYHRAPEPPAPEHHRSRLRMPVLLTGTAAAAAVLALLTRFLRRR